MKLYAGPSTEFIEDTVSRRIVTKLQAAFFAHFRYHPPETELNAWQHSLDALSDVMRSTPLDDHGVLLEYQLPLSSRRLDCLVTGRDRNQRARAVIVELKQWERVLPSAVDDCVTVFVGGQLRDVLHPSRQVGQYHEYLEDCHSAFAPGGIGLASCAFLHNLRYDPESELFHGRHHDLLARHPLFSGDRQTHLSEYFSEYLSDGAGLPVLTTVLESRYQPTKRLLEHTAAMIRGQKVYVLLDEQLVVFNAVLSSVEKRLAGAQKSVILVRGGPGTGKSVIALNLVGALSGKGINAHHATGSRAFTGNIRKVVGPRAGAQFRFFNSYTTADPDVIDVLILDEAHRLRKTSASR